MAEEAGDELALARGAEKLETAGASCRSASSNSNQPTNQPGRRVEWIAASAAAAEASQNESEVRKVLLFMIIGRSPTQLLLLIAVRPPGAHRDKSTGPECGSPRLTCAPQGHIGQESPVSVLLSLLGCRVWLIMG